MVNIVKNKPCVVKFSIEADKQLGDLNAVICFDGVDKIIDNLKTGVTVNLTAAETNTMKLGCFGAQMNVSNQDNTYYQIIQISCECFPEGTEMDTNNNVYEVLRVIKNTIKCKDYASLPAKVKANNRMYQLSIVDDREGIDWVIQRSVR